MMSSNTWVHVEEKTTPSIVFSATYNLEVHYNYLLYISFFPGQ